MFQLLNTLPVMFQLLQVASEDVRCHAVQLICWLCVIGSEVTWSEVLGCDWLRGLLALPGRPEGTEELRVTAVAASKTLREKQEPGECSTEPQT